MGKIKLQKMSAKKIIIACLLVIALVVQFAFLSFLFKGLTPEEDKKDENVVMSYTSNGNFNYKVYLKNNEFINEEYLGEGEAYILDLIDHININYLYRFSSTEKTNVSGTNKLVVKLKAYYKEASSTGGNSELLSKEKVIEEKVISFNDKAYSTLGTYDLYLDEYLRILKEFQSQVKISVDGYVEITSDTAFNGTIGGASYNDSYSNTLKVPLSSSVIKIENSKGNEKTNKVYEGDLVKTNKTVLGYIVVANIVVFLIICLLLKQLFVFTSKSEYEAELSKLLKNYDDIIVNTTTLLDIEKYKLIEIEEFKEILNLSRELLLPIMNYEVNKGSVTWFYVIKDNMLYRYIVSKNKLEKEKIKKEEESIKNKLPIDNAKKGLKDFLTKLKEKISNIIINIKSKLKKKNEVSNKDRFLNDDNEEKKDEE